MTNKNSRGVEEVIEGLHLCKLDEEKVRNLLHQELQKAREQAYKAGQSDLIYCLGNSFSKGKHHIDEVLLEANYQAKKLQDQSELDQPLPENK